MHSVCVRPIPFDGLYHPLGGWGLWHVRHFAAFADQPLELRQAKPVHTWLDVCACSAHIGLPCLFPLQRTSCSGCPRAWRPHLQVPARTRVSYFPTDLLCLLLLQYFMLVHALSARGECILLLLPPLLLLLVAAPLRPGASQNAKD